FNKLDDDLYDLRCCCSCRCYAVSFWCRHGASARQDSNGCAESPCPDSYRCSFDRGSSSRAELVPCLASFSFRSFFFNTRTFWVSSRSIYYGLHSWSDRRVELESFFAHIGRRLNDLFGATSVRCSISGFDTDLGTTSD